MSAVIRRGARCCLWIIATCGLAAAQQKTPMRFEVASIKPNKSGVFGYGGNCIGADKKQGPAARVAVPVAHCRLVNVPVEYMINVAYWAEVTPGARPPSVVGLPAWAKSERFDVETKAEDSNATQAQLYEMLRTLLTESFQLEFHRETKEVPAYRLIVAKGGPKLGTSKPDEPGRFGGRGPQGEAISRNYPLAGLVGFLTTQLDSPIDNATGLNGNYNFDLSFDPASTGHRFSNGAPPEIPNRPSLFSALQEQLGLKLEKTRLPVVSYIVDRIQRPSPN